MTVNGLWSAIASRCGLPIINDDVCGKCLAIDTPIWICEAQTSPSLGRYHSNPVHFLVYSRCVSLLKNGIEPVFVFEGANSKRTFSTTDRAMLFQQAQSSLSKLLRSLGVTVVEADGEAEALCGYLNAAGVCDGVVSNDADAFLFGAKVLLVNFGGGDRLESTSHGSGVSDGSNEEERHDTNADAEAQKNQARLFNVKNLCTNATTRNGKTVESVSLSSRDRLITFALLAGSDIGSNKGLASVGWKKAVEYIGTLKQTESGIEALRSLGNLNFGEKNHDGDGDALPSTTCCSICRHAGNKKVHEQNGCSGCGTQPGEKCVPYSNADHIRHIISEKIGLACRGKKSKFPDERLIR